MGTESVRRGRLQRRRSEAKVRFGFWYFPSKVIWVVRGAGGVFFFSGLSGGWRRFLGLLSMGLSGCFFLGGGSSFPRCQCGRG